MSLKYQKTELEGKVLEHRLAQMLKKRGYKIQRATGRGRGVDIIARKNDQLFLIEVKTTRRVDSSDIVRSKTVEGLISRRLAKDIRQVTSIIVSNGTVTDSARKLSIELRVPVVRPSEIHHIIEE